MGGNLVQPISVEPSRGSCEGKMVAQKDHVDAVSAHRGSTLLAGEELALLRKGLNYKVLISVTSLPEERTSGFMSRCSNII